MTSPIAIVGMACRYPDANSPGELWENVLAQRRAFRQMPAERLRREDYFSPDRNMSDRTYALEAALIEGYEFDRVKFKVVGSTYRSADLAHWLALDVASRALDDAGFPEAQGLPRDAVGVVLGNTLTGEFSRAALMRYRWPYVRRTVDAALETEGWSPEKRAAFLASMEERYKSPFAPVGEESLAGGLSNTIAGRICNHFNLKGGGYTVDGACASSLLAISTACSALSAGDMDMALAGGVDLSLDPFEIVGFAKAGALAADDMRVYDVRSAGFWPGEGCGFVVLMRHEEALAQGRRIYALIRGWGVSSDGSGGITRPEEEGQLLALQRAYKRAGFGPDTLAYFEGHGTGTAVGDTTELRTISRARATAGVGQTSCPPPAAIGSIKANIGHTKAAAGVAGFIKATMALYAQVLPPTTGCSQPHAAIGENGKQLRVLKQPQLWPAQSPLRAAVSAMGFGGINTHLVLDGVTAERRRSFTARERALMRSPQDAELFLFAAPSISELQTQVAQLQTFAAKLSRAEVADVAAALSRNLKTGAVRAAIVASSPAELADRLKILLSWLQGGATSRLDLHSNVFLASAEEAPAIGFAFPGQGSPSHLDGGIHRRRFAIVDDLYAANPLPETGDSVATAVAQPAIATASLAGLRLLSAFGVNGAVAVGHSLGELTALTWAGAMDEPTLIRVATARGKAMADLGSPTGAMAGIQAGQREVENLFNGELVVVAGLNSPRQTVISGPEREVSAVMARAKNAGLRATTLAVSHAFHSAHVAAATPALARHLSGERLQPLTRPVASTITGAILSRDEDLRALLCRQVTSPVRFIEAISSAMHFANPNPGGASYASPSRGIDLWIEVGPGAVLQGLIGDVLETPVIALDSGGPSLTGLLQALGAVFALSGQINHSALFDDRFTRPFNLDWQPKFFANPCESAPISEESHSSLPQGHSSLVIGHSSASAPPPVAQPNTFALCTPCSALDVVRTLISQRTELPPTAIRDDSKMLGDLHLNSISVGQLVAQAARKIGLEPPAAVTEFANATVSEIAAALEEMARSGGAARTKVERFPLGVAPWVRAFTTEWIETPPAKAAHQTARPGNWRVVADTGHPLAKKLTDLLAETGGVGVVVCLPAGSATWNGPSPEEATCIRLVLEGARAVAAVKSQGKFVLVQENWSAAGFARTLHLEMTPQATCIVTAPFGHPDAARWIVEELSSANGYHEVAYDAQGRRREPRLRVVTPCSADRESPALGNTDVLLVTGGGKGIAAECALALARATGVRLAILGRSKPDTDKELGANLARMQAAHVQFKYFSANVTDAEAVRNAVREAKEQLGPITAILHGAGTNVPRLIDALDISHFEHTLAPKISGLRHVLSAVDTQRLRVLVTFSSIIGRGGLHGEGDYALANEWLSRFTEQFKKQHPQCHCLALEWSVWSGVGMGERLGRIEALLQQGISPVTPDRGIEMLLHLLQHAPPAVSVVLAGRFGELPTLPMDRADLPFFRFLEKPRIHYPGVEFVVDTELAPVSDPYVDQHIYRGERLFPAVMGLEAMAQASMALANSGVQPTFHEVEFQRPIVISQSGKTVLRIAALRHESGDIEVALRCDATAFQIDHFKARCRFESVPPVIRHSSFAITGDAVPLDVASEVYPQLLFHHGRFRRLRGYRVLGAKECLAEIELRPTETWFGRYLPQGLAIGDPGARDAAIHAIQACIPHRRLLPTGVDKIVRVAKPSAGEQVFLHAREQSHEGDLFTYTAELVTATGTLIERWEGLKLRVIEPIERTTPWPEPLLACYLERRIEELVPAWKGSVVLGNNAELGRSATTGSLLQTALRTDVTIVRRPDGKPELAEGSGVRGQDALPSVSSSHCHDFTLLVTAHGFVACDMEAVAHHATEQWQDLLGPERFRLATTLAAETAEDLNAAATRVWTAIECLKKAGNPPDAPLVLGRVEKDKWILLNSGAQTIASHITERRGSKTPHAIAILVDPSAKPGSRGMTFSLEVES